MFNAASEFSLIDQFAIPSFVLIILGGLKLGVEQ